MNHAKYVCPTCLRNYAKYKPWYAHKRRCNKTVSNKPLTKLVQRKLHGSSLTVKSASMSAIKPSTKPAAKSVIRPISSQISNPVSSPANKLISRQIKPDAFIKNNTRNLVNEMMQQCVYNTTDNELMKQVIQCNRTIIHTTEAQIDKVLIMTALTGDYWVVSGTVKTHNDAPNGVMLYYAKLLSDYYITISSMICRLCINNLLGADYQRLLTMLNKKAQQYGDTSLFNSKQLNKLMVDVWQTLPQATRIKIYNELH